MDTSFIKPRYWPIWVAVGLLRLSIVFPHSQRMYIGKLLGRAVYRFSQKRRKIASINIAVCFPGLSKEEQQGIVKKHFDSLGMSVIESAMSWWMNNNELKTLANIEGIENLEQAVAQQRGVILLSAHFNSLEISSPLMIASTGYAVQAVYQANSNPLLEKIITEGRKNNVEALISHKNIKQMIRALKQKKIVWYAPDQGYAGKFSEIVPFFNTPAASNTAVSRLAKISGAVVVPFFIRQKTDNSGYVLTYLPALDNFPTEDAVADTLRYHHIVEQEIMKAPEQYLWIHRRFKNRPKAYPDLYKDIVLRK